MNNLYSKKIEETEKNIRILYEVTRFVSSLLHLQYVLDAIVDLLVREFGLDACSIRLLDKNGNLRIRSHKGLSREFIKTATRKPTIDSYSGDCFLTGKITIVNDADLADKAISTNRIVCEGIQSFALSPIKVEGDTIGVLVTASKKKNYFHERFNEMIYTISNQIGIAIRISQLYGEVYSFGRQLEAKVRERTAKLEDTTKRLVEAERQAAKGAMANRIAHELRNPLTVVGGFVRRLHEKASDTDPDKGYLEIIIEEVKTLEDKISKIIKIREEE